MACIEELASVTSIAAEVAPVYAKMHGPIVTGDLVPFPGLGADLIQFTGNGPGHLLYASEYLSVEILLVLAHIDLYIERVQAGVSKLLEVGFRNVVTVSLSVQNGFGQYFPGLAHPVKEDTICKGFTVPCIAYHAVIFDLRQLSENLEILPFIHIVAGG